MKKILLLLLLLAGCTSRTKEKGPTIAYFSKNEIDITTVQMQKVNSTSISYIGYEQQVLVIVFVEDYDRCYVYNDVPADIYHNLLDSESIGSYFNSNIKGKYKSNRIDGVEVVNGHIKYIW